MPQRSRYASYANPSEFRTPEISQRGWRKLLAPVGLGCPPPTGRRRRATPARDDAGGEPSDVRPRRRYKHPVAATNVRTIRDYRLGARDWNGGVRLLSG